jgi:hypothetical protein
MEVLLLGRWCYNLYAEESGYICIALLSILSLRIRKFRHELPFALGGYRGPTRPPEARVGTITLRYDAASCPASDLRQDLRKALRRTAWTTTKQGVFCQPLKVRRGRMSGGKAQGLIALLPPFQVEHIF